MQVIKTIENQTIFLGPILGSAFGIRSQVFPNCWNNPFIMFVFGIFMMSSLIGYPDAFFYCLSTIYPIIYGFWFYSNHSHKNDRTTHPYSKYWFIYALSSVLRQSLTFVIGDWMLLQYFWITIIWLLIRNDFRLCERAFNWILNMRSFCSLDIIISDIERRVIYGRRINTNDE